uniref:Uncharacterized protein n=1 Tax=Arundo donax TaxID=35708 RepID=A0A0A8YVA9_ARUDO
MYNSANFGMLFGRGRSDPMRWCTCSFIRKTYGRLPLFIFLSIFPPIDVNANILLYCLIFGKKCFDKRFYLLLRSMDKNSGGCLNLSILISLFLQQLEYIVSLHFLLSVLFYFTKPKYCVTIFATICW